MPDSATIDRRPALDPRRIYYLVIAAGLLVHLASIPLLHINPLEGDAFQFNNEANAILDGRGWINTEGPGLATTTYPTQVGFLLACKLIFGREALTAGVVIQHLMVILTGMIVWRIARRIGLGDFEALTAMALVIFFPHMIYVANRLISHTIGMLLAVLGVDLVMAGAADPPRRRGTPLLAGLVWGGATLARFTFQYFVPLWAAVRLLGDLRRYRRIRRQTLLRTALLVVGFVVVMTPWIIRVHNAEGGFGGYTDAWRICYSFNRAPAWRGNALDAFEEQLRADKNLDRAQLEAAYKAKVFENLRKHPGWFINNWITNLGFLLANLGAEAQSRFSVFAGIYYSILIGFGLVGLVGMTSAQHSALLPAYLLGAVILAVHVPIYGYIFNSFPAWACMAPVVARGIRLSFGAALRQRRAAV